MLVNLKEILKIAQERKCAVGAFNTVDMACARGIISAAEETNSPVIIMHAQVHEEMGLCTIEEVAPMMLFYAKIICLKNLSLKSSVIYGAEKELMKQLQIRRVVSVSCVFSVDILTI